MIGFLNFNKLFGKKTFVLSREIARRYSLQKALASNYVIPSFFKGVYYVPSAVERKGHFIENPRDFFQGLFNFVYGRGRWYWSLTTAARHHGLEWSSGMVLEVVTPRQSKTIDVFARISALEKKSSHRSKVLFHMLSSLGVNYVVIHKGKGSYLKETRFDEELGQVATKRRMLKDISLFLSKTRIKPLRSLYKSILSRAEAENSQ